MSLKPLFFSVLQLLGLRVRVGVEERRVLRHDPEQEMLLLGRHPPGPQQCGDVLGSIQSMHKWCLQKFPVFWIGPKVGCSGNDAAPPAFGRADIAFCLAPILPGSCLFSDPTLPWSTAWPRHRRPAFCKSTCLCGGSTSRHARSGSRAETPSVLELQLHVGRHGELHLTTDRHNDALG